LIRPKILSTLSIYEKTSGNCGVRPLDSDSGIASLSREADEYLTMLLNDWHIHKFVPLVVQHQHSASGKNKFSLFSRLLPALRFVLLEEDNVNPDLMTLIISLSSHKENSVSSSAYGIASTIFGTRQPIDPYLSLLLSYLMSDLEPERVFTALSLLYDCLIVGNHTLGREWLNEIEAVAFLHFASTFPETRQLVSLILEKVNGLLGQNGLMRHINNNLDKIESSMKSKILLNLIPNTPTVTPVLLGSIPLTTALMSHFYDIWLFCLREIITVIVSLGYTYILSRFNNQRQIIIDMIQNDSGARNPSDVGFLVLVMS
jgi:hypothetical protein